MFISFDLFLDFNFMYYLHWSAQTPHTWGADLNYTETLPMRMCRRVQQWQGYNYKHI